MPRKVKLSARSQSRKASDSSFSRALAVLRADALDCVIERGNHVAPIAHRQVNLFENVFYAFNERLCSVGCDTRQMDLHVADAAVRIAAVVADMKAGLLAFFHDQDRMGRP